MYSSKLLKLLKGLSIKELNRLGNFVYSDYFNKNDDIKALYTYLKSFNWSFTHPDLKKQTVFEKLFPAEPYRDEILRVLMSKLMKLSEQFLAMERIRENELMVQYHTLCAYQDKNMNKYFTGLERNMQRTLNGMKQKDIEHYYLNYLVSEQSIQNDLGQEGSQISITPKDVMDNFELYYLSNKVRYCASVINTRSAINTSETPILMFDELLKVLKKNEFKLNDGQRTYTPLDVPIIRYYYHVLIAFIEKDEEQHFTDLKALLFSPLQKELPAFDLTQIYNMSTSYCIQKVRAGKQEYYQHLFDIYEQALEGEALLVNGHLRHAHYSNVVKVALKLDRDDWAENFITDKKDRLQLQHRETVYNYNLAELYYYRKKHKAAASILNTVELINPIYFINYKILLLKSYYESGDVVLLESSVGNFRNWISRNTTLPEATKNSYKNLFDFTIRLSRIRERGKKSIEQLKAEVGESNTVEKQWLLEQIGGLSS